MLVTLTVATFSGPPSEEEPERSSSFPKANCMESRYHAFKEAEKRWEDATKNRRSVTFVFLWRYRKESPLAPCIQLHQTACRFLWVFLSLSSLYFLFLGVTIFLIDAICLFFSLYLYFLRFSNLIRLRFFKRTIYTIYCNFLIKGIIKLCFWMEEIFINSRIIK